MTGWAPPQSIDVWCMVYGVWRMDRSKNPIPVIMPSSPSGPRSVAQRTHRPYRGVTQWRQAEGRGSHLT